MIVLLPLIEADIDLVLERLAFAECDSLRHRVGVRRPPGFAALALVGVEVEEAGDGELAD